MGDNIQTCQEDGQWSIAETELECMYVDCGYPPELANGTATLTSNTTYYGSTLIHECSKGFKLHGNGRRTCLENGKWSGTEPRCGGKKTIWFACPPYFSINRPKESNTFRPKLSVALEIHLKVKLSCNRVAIYYSAEKYGILCLMLEATN